MKFRLLFKGAARMEPEPLVRRWATDYAGALEITRRRSNEANLSGNSGPGTRAARGDSATGSGCRATGCGSASKSRIEGFSDAACRRIAKYRSRSGRDACGQVRFSAHAAAEYIWAPGGSHDSRELRTVLADLGRKGAASAPVEG